MRVEVQSRITRTFNGWQGHLAGPCEDGQLWVRLDRLSYALMFWPEELTRIGDLPHCLCGHPARAHDGRRLTEPCQIADCFCAAYSPMEFPDDQPDNRGGRAL